jgi:hypothetical protein
MKILVPFILLLYLTGIFTIFNTVMFDIPNSHVIVMTNYFGIFAEIIPIILSISFIILVVGNMINAIELFLYDNLKLEKFARILKLAIIPYVIMNIIQIILSKYYVVILISDSFSSMFNKIIYYIILIVTSSYSIFYLILLRQKNLITKNQLRFHIILQTVIILDIIDILYIGKRYTINNMSNVA